MKLSEFFQQNPRAALGFSGGVDSVYLLWAAVQAGAYVQPYFIKTPFQPEFELKDAVRAAEQIGTELKILEYDILSDSRVASNPPQRCYYCKRALFSLIKCQAGKDGFCTVIDGTNASDDVSDRPGMRALSELGIRSPLRECGLTKEKIRSLSQKAGLFTWNKPAYACLATRVWQGNEITPGLLYRIENAENMLFEMGFMDFRVRVHDGAALLQFTEEEINRANEKRSCIIETLKPMFDTVLPDFEVRKPH